MITRDNLKEVIKQLDAKDKRRILISDREYTVLYLHIFNVGSYTTARTTNDYTRYKNVSRDGNAILETEEVKKIILE